MKTKINDTKKTRDNEDMNFKDTSLIRVNMFFLLFINFLSSGKTGTLI